MRKTREETDVRRHEGAADVPGTRRWQCSCETETQMLSPRPYCRWRTTTFAYGAKKKKCQPPKRRPQPWLKAEDIADDIKAESQISGWTQLHFSWICHFLFIMTPSTSSAQHLRPDNRGPWCLSSWAQSNSESADVTTGSCTGCPEGAPGRGPYAANNVEETLSEMMHMLAFFLSSIPI